MERIRERGPRGAKRKNENADRLRRPKSVGPWNDGPTGLSLLFAWTRQREAAITAFPEYGAAFCSPNCAERAAPVAYGKASCRLDCLSVSRDGCASCTRSCGCLCLVLP